MAPVLFRGKRISNQKQKVANISLGGIRVYSDEWLNVGERLELEFFLPEGSTVEAAAKVVWIKEMPPGSEAVYDLGMEFVELAEGVRIKLKAVLK